VGTIKVTILSILFAAPVAIFAALYTSMFAPRGLKEYIKPVIELLAGFPSVVIGFFALMVLASFFQNLLEYSSRLNGFVGAIAMGLAAIPIIYTLTEDALTAVPRTYIEASLGLGASIRQTAFSVVLPAATPGIFAAVLLGIGRVFGETMIALMATGNAAIISANPFDSVRTLSATIGAEMAEVVFGDTHYSVLFLIGSLLFIFTFALNAVAEFYFKNKVVRRIQGK
jgi:phosphate transport system permease protein